MKPETISSRRRYLWWPDATPDQKRSAYAMIGRFLKAKHPEFIDSPEKRPLWLDEHDSRVLFCKHHGIVGRGRQHIKEGNCPCAKTSAPSKSIAKNSIHFAVLMKDEYIGGCTTVDWMDSTTKWSGADMLPITTNPAQVSCSNCKAKIGAAIKQMGVGR